MADEKLTNRWLMVVAALVLQLCLGVLYAWSVFRAPLMKQFGWTVKEAGYPLMASFFFFAVGMIVAGRWQDKAGPRKVAIFGGVLLAAGCILAGAIGQSVGGMVFAYGILGGLGVGFAYVTPIATCIKWFPDMRGTITGLAVFGFGAGTLVFGPLINKLVSSMGLANTFYTVGVIMLVCVCGAGSFFKVPPAGYKPAGWNPPTPSSTTPTKSDWTPNEIIGNGQFYVLWLIYLFGAAAGLMIIGQAVPIGLEVAKLDPKVAAMVQGLLAKSPLPTLPLAYFYSYEGEYWVDQVTGDPVRMTKHELRTVGLPDALLAATPLGQATEAQKAAMRVPVYDLTYDSTPQSITDALSKDDKLADKLSLWGTTVPLIGIIAGALLAIAGGVLVARKVKA